ncbi:MAG: Fe-S cluster assembly sulfur transfer protein SufU [Planctomycetota bacterium]|jgi:nitrogen fixation NifU-like protein
MHELAELYQELILDHNKSPRNRGRLEPPACSSEGYNPLCGDRITLYVMLKDDVIEDIAFHGSGCAISTASASLMTESLKGRSIADAKTLFEKFHRLVAEDGGDSEDDDADPKLGKLNAFMGVRRFPARVKCATLAWHTLNAALDDRHDVVSTE